MLFVSVLMPSYNSHSSPVMQYPWATGIEPGTSRGQGVKSTEPPMRLKVIAPEAPRAPNA